MKNTIPTKESNDIDSDADCNTVTGEEQEKCSNEDKPEALNAITGKRMNMNFGQGFYGGRGMNHNQAMNRFNNCSNDRSGNRGRVMPKAGRRGK